MNAVQCPVCKLDCAPGDYGHMKIAVVPWHFNRGTEFTAMLAESADATYYTDTVCPGSEQLGEVRLYS